MKVKRLMEKLRNANPEDEVEVGIYQYNKPYPLYCKIEDNEYNWLQSAMGRHRIEVSLPNNENSYTITSTRKK